MMFLVSPSVFQPMRECRAEVYCQLSLIIVETFIQIVYDGKISFGFERQ